MQFIVLIVVLASVPSGAMLAGKFLDQFSETRINLFTKLSFPLACVVALHSPIFPETLGRALELSSSSNSLTVIMQSMAAAGIFGGTVAAILILFILAAELPFRWGSEKFIPFIAALRPCALLILLSLSFYLIVDWGELFFSGYLNG